ncbi:MAG TPA: rhodanese-like domain-containing protein [Kineosporiaceae bacterium]
MDLRSRTAFTAGHLAGTLNVGLDGSCATYLGWPIPWDTPLTLLGETPDQDSAAQRDWVRIGIDRPAAAATGTPARWAGDAALATLHRAAFTDLAAALTREGDDVTILDVRRDPEWRDGHILGTGHIPLRDLPHRLTDVPDGEVWVHSRPATAPPSPRPCWPPQVGASSSSTTTSPARRKPASTSSRRSPWQPDEPAPGPGSLAGEPGPGIASHHSHHARHRSSQARNRDSVPLPPSARLTMADQLCRSLSEGVPEGRNLVRNRYGGRGARRS